MNKEEPEQPVIHEQLKKFQFFTPEVIQDKPAKYSVAISISISPAQTPRRPR